MPDVVIIDPGVGNLFSITRAIEAVGGNAIVTDQPQQVLLADRLVLPGVGAFGTVMQELKRRGLVEPILQHVRRGRPLLGICVGMQILFELGEEYGTQEGLGLIEGRVRAIPAEADSGIRRIPHIGWSPIKPGCTDWGDTLLRTIQFGTPFYFLHSYNAEALARDTLAVTDFDGYVVTAMVKRANVTGCQFHPERSGENGLRLFRNFLNC